MFIDFCFLFLFYLFVRAYVTIRTLNRILTRNAAEFVRHDTMLCATGITSSHASSHSETCFLKKSSNWGSELFIQWILVDKSCIKYMFLYCFAFSPFNPSTDVNWARLNFHLCFIFCCELWVTHLPRRKRW